MKKPPLSHDKVSGGSDRLEAGQFQTAFWAMLLGVGIAIALTLLLKETGSAA